MASNGNGNDRNPQFSYYFPPPTWADPYESSSSSSSVPTWVIAAIVGVADIAGVLLFLYIRRRGKKIVENAAAEATDAAEASKAAKAGAAKAATAATAEAARATEAAKASEAARAATDAKASEAANAATFAKAEAAKAATAATAAEAAKAGATEAAKAAIDQLHLTSCLSCSVNQFMGLGICWFVIRVQQLYLVIRV
ncbi:hypothetical protein CRG98_026280 [Punica granatum]|uniref:Uncharacterized protein n=1 Tax=Punica granatum TaxID=22663 RepID=A0A2I0JBE5_PUNGR|nr:hypothetical protein CRG98_026280 [Punica granatum]